MFYLEKSTNECGNELLNESRGTISSPNYSLFNNTTYPPSVNCKWNKEGNHTLHTEVVLLDNINLLNNRMLNRCSPNILITI